MRLSIDPGVWELGWCASFGHRAVLAGCSKIPKANRARDPDLIAVAAQHGEHIRRMLALGGWILEFNHGSTIWVESMELRATDGLAVSRDLMNVQTVGVALACLLCGRAGTAKAVPVSTWKGSVPKSIHHPRILAALDPNERRIVDAACKAAGKTNAKEVLDAVGIFLHSVRRIDKSGAPRT